MRTGQEDTSLSPYGGTLSTSSLTTSRANSSSRRERCTLHDIGAVLPTSVRQGGHEAILWRPAPGTNPTPRTKYPYSCASPATILLLAIQHILRNAGNVMAHREVTT